MLVFQQLCLPKVAPRPLYGIKSNLLLLCVLKLGLDSLYLRSRIVNLVVFSDFGTVERDVSFDNFRVTVGVGLRVVVPAMGPVPLAFDFGFPVKSQDYDDERIFSFYVGINR